MSRCPRPNIAERGLQSAGASEHTKAPDFATLVGERTLLRTEVRAPVVLAEECGWSDRADMAGSNRGLPRPPNNPGLRDLVEGKRAWDARASVANQKRGFRGWHERGYLPHRDSPGLTQFITYHLADAFPKELLVEWTALLQIEEERERRKELESYLDKGRGKCWLRQPEIATICEQAFLRSHRQRYLLKAWCLMPNHLHVLVQVMTESMAAFVQKWKGGTARDCNRALGRSGSNFWADDYWDTYMRDAEQERRVVHYIESNPVKAGLVAMAKEWSWSSARFRGEDGELRLA